MDLRDDEKVIEFFLERDLSPQTEINYIRHLKYYINSSNDKLTPAELITEAINEERAGIYEEDRKIKKRFQKFKLWLKKQEMNERTQKTVLSNIKTFYKTLGTKWIPAISIKQKRKKQIKIEHLPIREEIKKALNESSIRYQAIILLAASSGLHKGDIRNIKLGEFLESFNSQAGTHLNGITDIDQLIKIADKKEIVLKWENGRYKNDIEYMTFSSPEATRAIVEYLRKDPPNSSDDFLFRVKGNIINENSFNIYFEDLNERLGLGECSKDEIKKYKRINLRNLRSRFGSLIMEAELGYRQIEYMMGHVLPAVQGAYFKLPSEDVMRRAYLKALPHLMIFEPLETRVLTSEDKAEFEAMKERERERDKLMQEMKETIDDLKKDRGLP
jgi:integrase